MSSLQTPLHKVQGLGASHSGTGHFWRQRITAVALVPLGLWFGFAMLGLAGTNEVAVLSFLARPWNALLMAAFAVILLYHMVLGLQDIVDDYVHTAGMKVFLRLAILAGAIATGATSLFALIRIAAST
ncbi:MAG TPA: succinate dehydrogenase, hydrophobic membrane anchor protein [Rhizomicrobium sp.]|jgi:succinate dehydrogenase / fumarate reductase membrane anchor subunit|nr:succinate dehydrogenase, hydrophobic membrane anchor protein [Rhizomicrobium sp.]